MFYGFNMNPMGPIGSGVSSGNVPAVANPLDNRPAGGGKGGGKGGGSPQPNYIASTPRPSMGKGGGKGGGFAPPPQNMYGGLGYNAYMGAGGIRPTSVPTQFSGFNQPTPVPRGGMIPLPETNFPLPPAPSAPPTPPAGKGGGLQARNDFVNADNELNTIRAEQMELERKARQEALNRSYYNQPEEPLGPRPQPAQRVDSVSMASLPASRNPFNRSRMSQMDRLNAAYRNRLERFNNPMDNIPEEFRPYVTPPPQADFEIETPEQRAKRLLSYIGEPLDRFGPVDPKRNAEYENYLRTRGQPSIGAGADALGLAALLGTR